MTTIKSSTPGQWGTPHIATSLATAEADESEDIARAGRWFPILGWAIATLAVFGCMSVAWFAS